MTRSLAAALACAMLTAIAGCGPPNFVMMTDDMAPTIHKGDIVAIDMHAYEERSPERGDIVAYRAPGEPGGRIRLGRVVALAGDRVSVADGVLGVNGEPVDGSLTSGEMDYEVDALDVPDAHVYILGDNRNRARDSHIFGPVPVNAIEGQITDVQRAPEAGE